MWTRSSVPTAAMLLCILGVALVHLGSVSAEIDVDRDSLPSLHEANLSAQDIHGGVLHTSDLSGMVTLVMNVACHCGYTDSNYKGLQQLLERYKEHGFEVLAFPCNQFGQQEPGTHSEIEEFVQQKYGDQFKLMSKVEVNGPEAHPIFAWLKAHTPAAPGQEQGADIAWNFEKFLIDKQGRPVKRYTSAYEQSEIEWDVYHELVRGSEEQEADGDADDGSEL